MVEITVIAELLLKLRANNVKPFEIGKVVHFITHLKGCAQPSNVN